MGKSWSVEEAASEIAKRLNLELLRVLVRWSPKHKKFIINTEGEHEIEEVLENADKYFIYTRFLLSTVEPSDLSGIPRSHGGITYYDPLLWATLCSAAPSLLFLDELTWIHRGRQA